MGKYPSKLKQAKVIPVFKSEVPTDPSNYRPISLLSVFNRIFEKLMYKRLKSFIDSNGILFSEQYGFRDKHSTQHAVLDIVNAIQENIDHNVFSCGIFLDFKKAFDTVDHSVLLQKLHYYSVRGTAHNWFTSYLDGRTQTTQINSKISSKQNLTCGVPQGSVLGPLLFLLYINDIYTTSSKFKFHLFADDTDLLYADKNLKSLDTMVNTELVKVSDWLHANKLTLNTKKSNYVIFHSYQKKVNYQVQIKLFDPHTNSVAHLEQQDYVKYFGILIDKNLSWKYHIDYVASKISRTIGIIARLRHFIPLSTLLTIYRSLVAPYLTYGIIAWGQAAKSNLRKILILQKRALRLMHFFSNRDHILPLFISSNILPINLLYFETALIFMHDVAHDSVPLTH